jgi:hypothetical protein
MIDPLRDFPLVRDGYRKGIREGIREGKSAGKAESVLMLLEARGVEAEPESARPDPVVSTTLPRSTAGSETPISAATAAEVFASS